jgi:hypothetical protein
MLISVIKPGFDRRQAASKLKGRLKEFRTGRLVSVIDFYVPFRIYDVEMRNAGRSTRGVFGIDAATGELDLFCFDALPSEDEKHRVETRRFAPVSIDEARAGAVIEERLKREVYLKGFFRVSGLKIEPRFIEILFIPYWVGLYERAGRFHIDAVNALNGSLEGGKLRHLIAEWFQSPSFSKAAQGHKDHKAAESGEEPMPQ